MVFRKTGCKYTKNISNLQIFLKKNAKFLYFYCNSPENIDAERGCAKRIQEGLDGLAADLRAVTDGLRTEQCIEVMYVFPYIVVGSSVRPCPGVALAVRAAQAVHRA